MLKPRAVLLVAAILSVSGAALAIDAQAAHEAREAFYKDMGKNFKALHEALKSDNPSTDDIKKFAAVIGGKAGKIPALFPAGTGSDSGVKTGAKPEIWQKWDEFQKDAGAFDGAAQALDAAARSGDIPTVKKAFEAVGEACKTCHETFRAKDH
jgi:cytochrome c556